VFLSPSPARVVSVREVPLGAAERRQPLAVEVFRTRLLAEDRQLAELLLPPARSSQGEPVA
jgi:hypothetical protein